MTILFVRHGETALNASRTMQPADTPLSERGIDQARQAALRLRALKPVAIVSSDMPRALRTAQEIARETGLNPTLTQLLHERNFGDLRGHPHDAFGFDPIAMLEAPPNGESMAEFTERCRQAFEHVVALRARLDGTLVVVTHGLVIHTILSNWIDLGDHVVPERIANTAFSECAASAPYAAVRVNCAAHLADTGLAEGSRSLSGG